VKDKLIFIDCAIECINRCQSYTLNMELDSFKKDINITLKESYK